MLAVQEPQERQGEGEIGYEKKGAAENIHSNTNKFYEIVCCILIFVLIMFVWYLCLREKR